jgi:hypothetical protein
MRFPQPATTGHTTWESGGTISPVTADTPGDLSASPYASGGGGTVLEHRYAATLLVQLLAGNRMWELGDNAEPVSVALQASDVSPVDDIVISGLTPDGKTRRVSIGVRRRPAFTKNDMPTIKLLRTYLQVLITQRGAIHCCQGTWRQSCVPLRG